MKTIRFLAATALATSSLFATSGTAWAQAPAASDADAEKKKAEEAAAEEPKKEGETIVVTGTRIARPNLTSEVPLTSVSVSELTDTGDISLGDALNDLPSLRSTFSSGNSNRFIGTAGINPLDLRGLGIARTLTLVNGRRHVTTIPGDYIIDVNTIPTDLVERVDIVTGGNSAVYGSDAVAGVVNFILKRDYDGIMARAQGGISSRGDFGNYFASLTAGKNFADGRGNVAVSFEYSKRDMMRFTDRDYLTGAFSGRCQFNLASNTALDTGVSSTNGIPDQQFLCGIKNAAISDAGTIGALDAASNPTRRYLRFDNSGNLFIDTPSLALAQYGSGNQVGGSGSTLRNTGTMVVGFERYTANLLARFDVSDAFKPFLEAKYVKLKAFGEGQPSFFQGTLPRLGAGIRCNNGFLNAQALTTLQSFGLCGTPATGTFPVSRFNIDFGGRGEKHNRETIRIVAGVEGTFMDDWKYEVALNYGKYKSHVDANNNLYLLDANANPDGFLLAADSIVAPVGFTGTNFVNNAAGQKVICRVNAVTNVSPNCVPINIFGYGNASPAALAFSHIDAFRDEKASQFVASAFVSGNTGKFLNLPGGPIAFVVGAEYRKETASNIWDPISSTPTVNANPSLNGLARTFFNTLASNVYPNLTVKDVFGEIRIPLLKDVSIAKELSVSAAGRISDYNNSTGTVRAYNLQGVYAPISDVKFRIAYATSVRAPTQSDLFANPSQSFAFVGDPCDAVNIGTNPQFATNCGAAGVPTTVNAATVLACAGTGLNTTVGAPWVNCRARTVSQPFGTAGNAALKAEEGESLTIGAVFEPRFVPGFAFTVDYYRIRVSNLIANLSPQSLLTNCYGSQVGLSSFFCSTIKRDPATGLLGNPIGTAILLSQGINFQAQHTRGMDFDVSYRKTFANGHKINLHGIATRVLTLDNYTDIANPRNPNRQLGELGDPLWAANLSVNYDFGKWDVTYSARYIGKQTIGAWEDQHEYQSLCTNGTVASGKCLGTVGQIATTLPDNADLTAEVYYPAALYHSVRVGVEVNSKFSFYGGIDNLLDKQPPYGLLGTVGGDPYDSIGRVFYAGVRAKF